MLACSHLSCPGADGRGESHRQRLPCRRLSVLFEMINLQQRAAWGREGGTEGFVSWKLHHGMKLLSARQQAVRKLILSANSYTRTAVPVQPACLAFASHLEQTALVAGLTRPGAGVSTSTKRLQPF